MKGEEADRALEGREFGGALGVAAIMLGSHAVMYYLWIA